MITLKKNKHYLIRQRYQYGGDKRDDIMVVQYIRKATRDENLDYMSDPTADGYIGIYNKTGDEVYFSNEEVISSIVCEIG